MSALDLPYALDAQQRAAFARDGHVFLPGVLPREEVGRWRAAIALAVRRFGTPPDRPLAERDTYGRAFQQHMNLWTRCADVRRFVLAARFAGIAADLLGVERVRVYHDQALLKEPGGGPTPWHVDQYYWPVEAGCSVTMWMPLVDVEADMGPITFATGSHLAPLDPLPISDESEELLGRAVTRRGFPLARRDALSAGDATFHAGGTLHAAPGNSSARLREVMTVIYVADGARATAPANPHQEADLATWMPGVRPGEAIASPLNPLVPPARAALP